MRPRTRKFPKGSGSTASDSESAPVSSGIDEILSSVVASGNRTAALRGVNIVVESLGNGWRLNSLVEIASTECKFVSDEPLKWGTPVVCALCCAQQRHIQKVNGRVHWCRKVKDAWQVGVFLDVSLDEEFREVMGNDMRSALRYEVNWPATVIFEGSTFEHDVVVQDYSLNGVSFTGDLPYPTGAQFRLFSRDATEGAPIANGRIVSQKDWRGKQSMVGGSVAGRELSWFLAIAPADA